LPLRLNNTDMWDNGQALNQPWRRKKCTTSRLTSFQHARR